MIIGIDIGKSGGICVMISPTHYRLIATSDDNNVYHDHMAQEVKAQIMDDCIVVFENPYGYRSNWLNRATGFVMTELRLFKQIKKFDFVATSTWKERLKKLIPEMTGRTSQKDYWRLIKEYLKDDTLTHDQCAAYGIAYSCWSEREV
jgi:hypothetical protein